MASPNWQFSKGLGQNYYVDDNGAVHYQDGSQSGANNTWVDQGGNVVYAANSAGPASTAGGAYKAPATGIGAPPGGSLAQNFSTGNNAASQWNGAAAPAQARPGDYAPSPAFGGAASSGPAAGSMSAVGGISGYTAGQNPYLEQMGNAAIQQNTQNFQRNVMPGIASQAMAAGGFGGSRQGVIEANAMNDLNTANANALTGLAGGAYGQALNYDVSRRGQDQSFNLGLGNLALGNRTADQNYALGNKQADNSFTLGQGNLGLGYFNGANNANIAQGQLGLNYANLDRSIANDNRSWQQQGYTNTLGLWDRVNNNNQTGIGAGTNINNTPLNYWNNLSQGANSIGQGYGTSTSSGSTQGNPMLGALGGAQLGGQVSNWWNGGSSANNDPFGMISF